MGLCFLQAVQSRLDALENDNADDAPDPFGLAEGDDDEFVMGDSEEDGEPTGCAASCAAAALLLSVGCLQASGSHLH